MLLKRFLVLAVGVLIFIVVFIGWFQYQHWKMENHFREVRKSFGVEGATLTSTAPATSPATPAAGPSFETNALIGPVPPPSVDTNAAPDPNAAPAPETTAPMPAPAPSTDTNAAPAAPTPSTQYDPAMKHPSIFQMAAYRPFAGAEVRIINAETGQSTTNAVTPAPAAAAVPVEAAPAPTETVAAPAVTVPGIPVNNRIIVLLYHQFRPAGVPIPIKYQWTMHQDVFESEMKYLQDGGYNVIPMADLVKFLKHEGTVPPKAVVITIDDGYKSAIVYAAPILKKYGFPWTYFIYPDFITVAEGSGAASWNDLKQLQAEGVDIESHSMTHPDLRSHKQKIKGVWHSLSADEYAEWLKNETAGSKAVLEEHLGKPVTCFAYPYGDHNPTVEAAAIAAGYEAIFTVDDNPVHSTTNLHSIGRYTITQSTEKAFPGYLRQGALVIANAEPAAGATINEPRPVITAELAYSGKLDAKSIETSVGDFGVVRHDFDPQTNTIRLYLPRDLIDQKVLINIRARDASSGQIMVANWRFNYEPTGGAIPAHAPIAPKSTPTTTTPATNAPEATEPDTEKKAAATPLEKPPTQPVPRKTD